MTQFRHVAIAAALLASAGAAGAQTTVITREPVQTQTIVTTQPALTPVQRQTIYRTIVRERVVPAPPSVEYRIGARVPEGAHLYAVPQSVAVEIPAVKTYKYMMVNGHVVLVDPATSEIVADVTD